MTPSLGVGVGLGFRNRPVVAGELILDLLTASVARASSRTGRAYDSGAVIADGEIIETIGNNVQFLEGYRFAGGSVWSGFDNVGAALPDLRGLDIADTSTNLLPRSEEFDNSAWFKTGSHITTPNSVLAPDGTMTADTLDDTDTGSSAAAWSQNVPVPNDTSTYTLCLRLQQGTAAQTHVQFAFTGGTLTKVLALITWATTSTDNGTLTDIGNGWFELRLTLANNGLGNTSADTIIYAATANPGFTGSIYAWGAQLNLGAFSGPYVKTTTIAAASLADIWSENWPLVWDETGEIAGVHVLTPRETAASGALVGAFVDASNFWKIEFNGTHVVFSVVIATVTIASASFAYASTAETAMEVQYEYDGVNISVGARDVGGPEPTLATDSFSGTIPKPVAFGIGNDGNSGAILQATNKAPILSASL